MLLSYAAQGVPTFAGQIARSVDPVRRDTYIDKNKSTPDSLQRFIQSSIQSKIPVWELFKMAYVDEWGRKDKKENVLDWILGAAENFISPGYGNRINETPVDEEIARLYAATGDKGILPDEAAKYFNEEIEGQSQRKELTAKEYEELAILRGQTAYSVIYDIIMSDEYAQMTDAEKAKVINEAYTYADQVAKDSISSLYAENKWVALARDVGAVDYLLIKSDLDENKSNEKLFQWLAANPRLNEQQIALLIASKYNSPDEVKSQSALGYVYQLNDEDEEAIGNLFGELVSERLAELRADPEFKNASTEEQGYLMKDLYTQAREDASKIYGSTLDTNGRAMTLGRASAIGKEAFLRCGKITTAGLYGSVKGKKGYSFEFPWTSSIPENAFSGMNKLKTVVLPDTVKSIGKNAFKGCKSLESINLPENVKCDKKTFKDCKKLSV